MSKKINILTLLLAFLVLIFVVQKLYEEEKRKRARELGIEVGILKTGKYNAITDVEGVLVGHKTLIKGENIRTGVTIIMPHNGNIFREKVPAGVFVGNAFGKAVGFTQIEELGNIETPIALTNTLNTFIVADALIEYTINLEGNENVRSVNPVVGETNDGGLNDIRSRPVSKEDVFDAIKNAHSGKVEEGSVGAGTGTRCLGFKGGIGTSSRVLEKKDGGFTVGVLVQTNFGGNLTINGAPVGRELRKYYNIERKRGDAEGSCMIVVATDAPLSPRNLKRLAKRAFLAFGKVGSYSGNGSGDYVIAFSTYENNRIIGTDRLRKIDVLPNGMMNPLFMAVVEATEEAIYNSLFMATTVKGINNRISEAIPIEKTLEVLKKYNSLNWGERFK